MNKIFKCGYVAAALLAVFAGGSPALAREKTESELIQDLGSPSAGKVNSALQQLEKRFPTSTNALPIMRNLLGDSRLEVKRKAARVLGVLQADVDQNDIKHIRELLQSSDPAVLTDGLKALRGLKAPDAVPDIVPLLQHPNPHIVRDACRTLAVLGNKDLIPSIEPLLQHKDPAVQQDAKDAIAKLRGA